MNPIKLFYLPAFLTLVWLAPALATRGQTVADFNPKETAKLGDAAPVPPNLPLNPPKPIGPQLVVPVTGGLVVNTDSREEVRSFYNAIFPTSENIPQDSTADAGSCTPGHNSDAFQNAELLRINWYRAMAGMPANISLDPIDDWGSQQMAVITRAGTNRWGRTAPMPPLILFGISERTTTKWVTGAGFFIRRRQSWGSGIWLAAARTRRAT
jgi:hypothetical protein